MKGGGFNIEEALNTDLKDVKTEVNIPVDLVMPNRFQPRVFFRNIDELAASIEKEGQLEPIAVRVIDESSAAPSSFKYEVIYGGRRLAACQKIGRGSVRAIVYGPGQVSDEQMELWANIENTQREDLRFLEAMKSFAKLFEKYGSVKTVSEKTGKTTVTVQYYLNVAKAFDCHDEFKRLLKDLMLSSKKADGFTYTIGGRFAQVAQHIASLDPDVSFRGDVLKKNKREFKRIIERFNDKGLVESMKWVEDKISKALGAAGGKISVKSGDGTGLENGGLPKKLFVETEKEIRLSVRVSKLSGVDVDTVSKVKSGVAEFISRIESLVTER